MWGPLTGPRSPTAPRLTALAAVLAFATLLPAPCLAGTDSKRDRAGDVHARGLTTGQRRALDVVSVTARGESSAGLFVTATFRGNFERLIGRGRLRRGLAALVVRPKSAGQSSAGVVTRGPGIVGETLHRTRSGDVGVVRAGRKLSFFIAGMGVDDVDTIEVRVFSRSPRPRARGRGAKHRTTPIYLDSAEDWLRITDRAVTDGAKIEYGPETNCADLRSTRVRAMVARQHLEADEKKLIALRRDIDRTLDELKPNTFDNLADRLTTALGIDVSFSDARRDLALAARVVDKALKLNRAMQDHLKVLQAGIESSISRRCSGSAPPSFANQPPVIRSFKAVFGPPATCATCTRYTVDAIDPESGKELTYYWEKTAPPGGDAAATNCGTFTPRSPEPHEAVWDHPNEGPSKCSHEAAEHPGHITVAVADPQGRSTRFTYTGGSASTP